jgi:hypothetical protein
LPEYFDLIGSFVPGFRLRHHPSGVVRQGDPWSCLSGKDGPGVPVILRAWALSERTAGRPRLIVETAYLQNLDAERLKPGEQPVQRRLIGQRAMYYGPHRFH